MPIEALLDAAILLAEKIHVKNSDPELEKLSFLDRYSAYLLSIYPFAHTAITYIDRWPEEVQKKYDDPFLVALAEEAKEDERAHDELIIHDLEVLGVGKEKIKEQLSLPSSISASQFFLDSVNQDPLHLLAWLYLTEKMSTLRLTQERLAFMKKKLGRHRHATRFIHVHSASGLDVEHVRKRILWIKNLNHEYQQKIIRELFRIVLDQSLSD